MIGQCQRKCCSFSSPPPLPHSFLGPFPLWGMIYINYIYIYIYNRGEWPSGLRHCDQNMVQNPLGTRLGLGTQPRFEAPGDLRVEYVKRK